MHETVCTKLYVYEAVCVRSCTCTKLYEAVNSGEKHGRTWKAVLLGFRKDTFRTLLQKFLLFLPSEKACIYQVRF
jgi:hypothetical protein